MSESLQGHAPSKILMLGDFLDDIDPQTKGLIFSFFLSISMAIAVVVFWLLIRRCRGDKQEITNHGSEISEVNFDENFKKTQMLSKRFTGRMFSKGGGGPVKDSLKSSLVMPSGSIDRSLFKSGALRRETGMISGGNEQQYSNSSGYNPKS